MAMCPCERSMPFDLRDTAYIPRDAGVGRFCDRRSSVAPDRNHRDIATPARGDLRLSLRYASVQFVPPAIVFGTTNNDFTGALKSARNERSLLTSGFNEPRKWAAAARTPARHRTARR